MSNELKSAYKAARKAQQKCTAFKWMSIISGAIAIILGGVSLIAPPPWQVHDSVLKLIAEFMGVQAMFEAMVAFESGRDAKITHGNTSLAIDGDGDGKINAE